VKYKEGNNGFGQPGGIRDAAFSADGRFVASCLGTGQSGYVHLFDAPTGRIIASEKLAYCPQAIAFSRDGNNLAVAGGIGPFNLNVWNISDLTSPGAKQGK
jgi:WD40 repeat protein